MHGSTKKTYFKTQIDIGKLNSSWSFSLMGNCIDWIGWCLLSEITLWRLSLLGNRKHEPWAGVYHSGQPRVPTKHFARANKMFPLRRSDLGFWNKVELCKDTGVFCLFFSWESGPWIWDFSFHSRAQCTAADFMNQYCLLHLQQLLSSCLLFSRLHFTPVTCTGLLFLSNQWGSRNGDALFRSRGSRYKVLYLQF